jgi:hypothetical protein
VDLFHDSFFCLKTTKIEHGSGAAGSGVFGFMRLQLDRKPYV